MLFELGVMRSVVLSVIMFIAANSLALRASASWRKPRCELHCRESGSTSKGMKHVALAELGSGCCHGGDSTKAAIRACNNAIEWNSVKVRTIIPGGYEAMRLHVHLGVPEPAEVDLEAVARCFPHGQLLPILVEEGGLRGSHRAGLPADEPTEAHMTVAVACVTVGFGKPDDVDSESAAAESEPVAQEPEPVAARVTPATPATSVAPANLGRVPTDAEMQPGSPEMLLRARETEARLAARVLAPYEAAALVTDEDDVEIVDVRSPSQRANHVINERSGVGVMGALCVPLEDIVGGSTELLPPPDKPVLLVCSQGPRSLVALDYLADAWPRAVCVEGGIAAWDRAKLPTEQL